MADDGAEQLLNRLRSFRDNNAAAQMFMKFTLGKDEMNLSSYNAAMKNFGVQPSNSTQKLFRDCETVPGTGKVSIDEFVRFARSSQAPIKNESYAAGSRSNRADNAHYMQPGTARSLASEFSGTSGLPSPQSSTIHGDRTMRAHAGAGDGMRSAGGYPGSPGADRMRSGHSSQQIPISNRGGGAAPQPVHQRKPEQDLDLSAVMMEQLRKTIIHRGGSSGLSTLGRTFRIVDRDRSGNLSVGEMKVGLQRFGLKMSDKDVKLLFNAMDADHSGKLNFTELLRSIRGPINQRRSALIDAAFKVMDKTGDGIVNKDDMTIYNSRYDPDVKSGKITADEALDHVLANFDQNNDGTVTKQEFHEYYRNVSASIENDDYFELMIRNAWHIPGGEGWCANSSNKRLLVITQDGEQKVVCLEADMGLDLNNRQAVMNQLKRQGIKNIVDFKLTQ